MRLIRLSANVPTFRTVEFNRSGLSLIVGGRESANPGETFNGVGKSLMIFLLDFCLGSNRRDGLAEGLEGWRFRLDFEIDSIPHSVERATDAQDTVELDGKSMSVRQYTDFLSRVFDIPNDIPKLTFRGIIPHFIRQSREGYQSFDRATRANVPQYDRLLRVAFLLGLDVRLVHAKHKLRTDAETIRRSKRQFENDPIIRDILSGGMELELEVSEAADEMDRLRRQLESFRVAENYEEVQQEARSIRAQITQLRNELHLKVEALQQIQRSLSLPTDLDAAEVVRIYEEATAVVPEIVVKRLEDVMRFHEYLLAGRRDRLTREQSRLTAETQRLEEELSARGRRLDEVMRFLGSHNALDEFIALSERLALATARHERLDRYQRLLDEYDTRLAAAARDMQQENILALEYLKEHRALLSRNLDVFRGFARRAYPDKKAGIIVENNSGDNQIRFDIDARIEADASDGINEVKTFCFDMTVMMLGHNHDVRFIVHDSRLFSDIDPRQRAQILLAAREASVSHDFQYIATMNEDQLEALRPELGEAEYARLVNESTVLRLTDDSPSGKLLGIELDLRYERQRVAN